MVRTKKNRKLHNLVLNCLYQFFLDNYKIYYKNKSREIVELLEDMDMSISDVLNIKDSYWDEVEEYAEELGYEDYGEKIYDMIGAGDIEMYISENEDELKEELIKEL